jgi:peptide/nickel transport system permease protein
VKVIPEIARATPVTMSLVLGATVVWIVVSVLLGVIAAVLRGSIWDRLLMVVALIGISVPVFWLGEVANLFTQDRWHGFFLFSWIPPLGYTPLTKDPLMWFRHLVVPWLVLATLYIGIYARVLRAALLDASDQDFVRTARAKGISERRVLVRHLLRTSMITFVSVFGLDFGVLVGGGALLVEVVFGLPGVGRLTYQSLTGLDLPVIMATVLYAGFFIVIVNALVDLLYARLDPRIREG